MSYQKFEPKTLAILTMLGKALHRAKLDFNAYVKNDSSCQCCNEKRGFLKGQYIEAHNSFQSAKSIAFYAQESHFLSDHDIQAMVLDNLKQRLNLTEKYQKNIEYMSQIPNAKPLPDDVIGESHGALAMARQIIEKAQDLEIKETQPMNPS